MIAVGPMLQPVLTAVTELSVTVLYAVTVRPFDAGTLRRYGTPAEHAAAHGLDPASLRKRISAFLS